MDSTQTFYLPRKSHPPPLGQTSSGYHTNQSGWEDTDQGKLKRDLRVPCLYLLRVGRCGDRTLHRTPGYYPEEWVSDTPEGDDKVKREVPPVETEIQ